MKAVGYWKKGLAISEPKSLEDIELPDPVMPEGRDLLIRVFHATAKHGELSA